MRINMKYVLIVAVLYCCCWGDEAQDERNEQLRDLPCPNAEDIFPCVCSVGSDYEMEMDCSNVTSNAELAYIFSTDFPFTDFGTLKINNNNYLTALNEGDLGQLATFNEIEITSTTLERIEYNVFMASYDTLTVLVAQHSKLNFFPSGEIDRFTKLTSLHLGYNELVGFPPLASTSLRYLTLSHNPVGHINRTSLENMPSLHGIHLDDAGIKQILPGTFSGLQRLSDIHLTHNELEVLEAGAIEMNEASNVYIFHNALTYIAEGAFRGVYGLYVSNNQLTELPEAVFRPILDYEYGWLYAYSNPLKCGCDIAWLITNTTYMSQLLGNESCQSGELLIDLDPEMYLQLCS